MLYIVSIAFEDDGEHDDGKNLWEERFFVVEAILPDEAQRAGWELAKRAEGAYQAVTGKISSHARFVIGCYELDEAGYDSETGKLKPPSEVFSRFLRESEAKSLATRFRSEEL